MRELASYPNIIIVNNERGEINGPAEIKYEKESFDELYEMESGGPWSLINVFVRTGQRDADRLGHYSITLKPGQTYEVGIFEGTHGPLTMDPILHKKLKIYCLWKKPEVREFIVDENRAAGGTYYWRQFATSVPTDIAYIGTSQTPPLYDSNKIPTLENIEGNPTAPITVSQNHAIEIIPLTPGNHYFFIALIVDSFGNWQVIDEQFDTLKRQITVQFKTLHIYNDGDSGGHGKAQFWFYLREDDQIIEQFHMPEFDIDDWSGTDRPYPLGFAHIGSPNQVKNAAVLVSASGDEEDDFLWFEMSDSAMSNPMYASLPLPAGRFVENVTNSFFHVDCPASNAGSEFHFGVDIIWSSEYLP